MTPMLALLPLSPLRVRARSSRRKEWVPDSMGSTGSSHWADRSSASWLAGRCGSMTHVWSPMRTSALKSLFWCRKEKSFRTGDGFGRLKLAPVKPGAIPGTKKEHYQKLISQKKHTTSEIMKRTFFNTKTTIQRLYWLLLLRSLQRHLLMQRQ